MRNDVYTILCKLNYCLDLLLPNFVFPDVRLYSPSFQELDEQPLTIGGQVSLGAQACSDDLRLHGRLDGAVCSDGHRHLHPVSLGGCFWFSLSGLRHHQGCHRLPAPRLWCSVATQPIGVYRRAIARLGGGARYARILERTWGKLKR